MKKRILAMLLVLCMAISLLPMSVYAEVFDGSGTCGDNLSWLFDFIGTLTISGSGAMDDYPDAYSAPWYAYDNPITTVVMSDGITSIGDCAFSKCSKLTSVDIPDSVTSIGNEAFYACSELTSVDIPDSVTSIGDSTFNYCSSLTSVDIPDGVTTIGANTFNWCSRLTSVDIPDGVTSIGDGAFNYCRSLTRVDIPDSVTSIGANAFSNCSSLTSVEIPASVTTISDGAFASCSSLTSVDIPDGVTTIGADAFSGCHNLTSVTIPDSVTSIGDRAFRECSSLTSVDIPDGVTSIGDGAFASCSNLTSVDIPDSVTSIGASAFSSCSNLTSVDIPDSVTSIGANAFYNCDSLTSVEIPASVTTISDGAFEGCSNLTSVTIPSSVTTIGANAFSNCISLTSVEIPASVTTISDGAFAYCRNLASVTIPDSVTTIGDTAFARCTGLADDDGFVIIRNVLHSYVGKAANVVIPDGVTAIGDCAFAYCNLASVTIPDSVTTIGENAFWFYIPKIIANSGSAAEAYAKAHEIPYADHPCSYSETVNTAATCTEKGNSTYTCSVCGDSYTADTPALGHDYQAEETTPATCIEQGIMTFTCSRCNDSYTRNFPGAANNRCVKETTVTKVIETWDLELASDIAETVNTNDTVETEYTYDDEGRISVTTVKNSDGTSTVTQYAYDEDGKLLTKTDTFTTYYSYDDAGRCIKEYTPHTESEDWLRSSYDSIEYTYDEDGNCIQETREHKVHIGDLGGWTKDISYTYDDNGNCISKYIEEDSTDGRFTSIWTYTYDDNGNCLSEITTTDDGASSEIQYTYDDNGNCLSEVLVPDEWDSGTSHEVHYTYDSAGNLIEKTELGISRMMDIWITSTVTTTYSYEIFGGHESLTATVTAPTCTAKGYTTHACSKCGYSYTDTEVAALGHSFTNYIYNNDAEVGKDGTETASCSRGCGATDTRTKTGSALDDTTLAIKTQPADASAKAGNTAKFTVTATGTGLKYQWQYSKDSGKTWYNATAAGNTTATVSVSVLTSRNGYLYRCVVTDRNGKTITSNSAKLTVLLAITKQPADASAKAGDTAKFTVTASGIGLTYQWQYSKNNGKNWYNATAEGNTTATVSVSVLTSRNGYLYRCVVKDSNGKTVTSNAAKLTVLPTITKQPADASAKAGDTAKFTVTASGIGLTYQWQYSKDSGKNWYNSPAVGNTTNTVSISAAANKNGYLYRCVITDGNGETLTSNAAKLTVLPTITKQPADASAKVGDTAKFTVTASGIGLTYQWQYSKDSGKKWYNATAAGNTTATISVSVATNKNGYLYRCVITDGNGETLTSSTAKLTVLPAITRQPADASAKAGDTAKFTVTATGVGLTYQWQYSKDSGKTWTNSPAEGNTTSAVSITMAAYKSGYLYRCVITDGNGKTVTSNSAKLAVVK